MQPSMIRYPSDEKIVPVQGDHYGVWIAKDGVWQLVYACKLRKWAMHNSRQWKRSGWRSKFGRLPEGLIAPKEQGDLFGA